jgi:hypothetical protein
VHNIGNPWFEDNVDMTALPPFIPLSEMGFKIFPNMLALLTKLNTSSKHATGCIHPTSFGECEESFEEALMSTL